MQMMEHLAGQIGAAPFAVDGRQVKAVEIVNMRRGDIIAGQPQQPHTRIRNHAAFLADILAFAR